MKKVKPKQNRPGGYRNRFRIIAGAWRGRRFEFPDLPGIRPSPDRVRETLFNWLQPVLAGARCLDLFAGSGALGLEALSRGAAEVVFVDREAPALDAIRRHLAAAGAAEKAIVIQADALAFLSASARPFDVVFLDPPFASDLLARAMPALEAGGWLAEGGYVYLECPARAGTPAVPLGWRLIRSKRAGNVGYHLAVRDTRPRRG
ncbi:MAG TPA: 16S rRNA (guanine(966)-N(2))-methyltransferase RsmD [Gammaproteobacteria bacterium]|nr:16S rRNA (guanine(966)-N(2))-methyltransferase RsmD [Gammaproteobacteria bacterium]